MKLRVLSSIFLGLFIHSNLLADSPLRQRDIALKVEPYQYLIGSFNAELEIAATESVSVLIPLFYAHNDAAAIPDALFWNSSLGLSLGVKFHIGSQSLTNQGFFLAGDGGAFVVYPFEQGQKKVFYKGVYSELSYQKNPFWLPVFRFYGGYDWVSKSGFMLEVGGGLAMYAQFPVPFVKVQTGWAF